MSDGSRASKDVNCLFSLAEKELRTFVHALDQLFGPEQARRSALEWIHDMELKLSSRHVYRSYPDYSLSAPPFPPPPPVGVSLSEPLFGMRTWCGSAQRGLCLVRKLVGL